MAPDKDRKVQQQEDTSDEESSDEEVRPTAYQRLVSSSRRDLPLPAPAAHAAPLASLSTSAAAAEAAADNGAAPGDPAAVAAESESDDEGSDDGDTDPVASPFVAGSDDEHQADERDSFRRIFFGEELSDAEFTRQRHAAAEARLRTQGSVGNLRLDSTVASGTHAVHRKLTDNRVRSGICARYAAVAGRSKLTKEEAQVYSYLREYCDVFHAACSHKSAERWERLTLVHVLNHVLR